MILEILLLIVGIYLSIVFTLFLIFIKTELKKEGEDIKTDNKIWKEEVRKEFNRVNERLFFISQGDFERVRREFKTKK